MMDRPAILVYLAFALLIMAPLMRSGYYLALDMQFGPNSFADWQFSDFYGLQPSSYGSYFPLKMVMASLSSFMGVEAVEKLLLFAILVLCGISMHSSLPKEHGFARYFAGLLYLLNPFVFVRFLAGHWSLLLSYSLWPFALFSFHRFLERPDDRNALARAAIMTTLAAISSHGIIMLLICYAVLLISHILRRGLDLTSAKRIGLIAGLVLLMNLYWILPTVLLFDSIYSPASAESYFEDFGPEGGGMGAGAALATMHGFWRSGFTYTKDVFSLWFIPFILIAVLAIQGFLALLKERALHALSLLAIFLIGLLLALGPSSPMLWVFTLFGDSFPLHMIFRDSQKFVGMICLVYSVLGSYGADSLLRQAGRFRLPFFAVLILVPIIYNFGFFGLLGQIWPTNYPADWYAADAIMAADNVDGRLLAFPAHLYNTYPWVISAQRTLANPAGKFFSKPVISETAVLTPNVLSDTRDTHGRYLTYLFDNRQHIDDTAELLMPLGVRYVMIFKGSEDSDNYLWLFSRRGGVDNITLVYESDSIYLFRNELVRGQFFSSEDAGYGRFARLLASTGKGVGTASYQMITPASYIVTDSSLPNIVFSSPPSDYMVVDGGQLSTWHGIASTFDSPGRVYSTIFPGLLALFLVSWGSGIILLTGTKLQHAILLSIPGILLFILISDGTVGPSGIGALLIISIAISLMTTYVRSHLPMTAFPNFFKR